jgi:hypothetical protein
LATITATGRIVEQRSGSMSGGNLTEWNVATRRVVWCAVAYAVIVVAATVYTDRAAWAPRSLQATGVVVVGTFISVIGIGVLLGLVITVPFWIWTATRQNHRPASGHLGYWAAGAFLVLFVAAYLVPGGIYAGIAGHRRRVGLTAGRPAHRRRLGRGPVGPGRVQPDRPPPPLTTAILTAMRTTPDTPGRSVLDELVFVGRAGPGRWQAESPPLAMVPLSDTGRELSTREKAVRVVALVLATASIILAIALGVGFAA